jgi:hypothetical protein
MQVARAPGQLWEAAHPITPPPTLVTNAQTPGALVVSYRSL